jgi:serine/threonine-protein phosphatase 2A regulatory subunit A
MVASCFNQLVNALGDRITQSDLAPAFVRLLRDTEAEVRTAAASKVSGVSKHLSRDVVAQEIIPAVRQLSVDESAAVREALASDIMGLAPFFWHRRNSRVFVRSFSSIT